MFVKCDFIIILLYDHVCNFLIIYLKFVISMYKYTVIKARELYKVITPKRVMGSF